MILASELRTEQPIHVDLKAPRVAGIFGKRGSGKTTTLVHLASQALQQGHLVILVDPMGTIRPAHHRRIHLGRPVDPPPAVPAPDVRSVQLDPTALDPDAWLALFQLTPTSPMGIVLFRAVLGLNAQGGWWSLDDLMAQVLADSRAGERTRQALENRLQLLRAWDLFAGQPGDPLDVLSRRALNVIDMSVRTQESRTLRQLVLRLLATRLFQARLAALHSASGAAATPPVMLAIDEAHNFVGGGAASPASSILTTYAKEGRQPQVSLVVATQQPGTLAAEVLSQCDLLVVHHLSHINDIKAAGRLAATYAPDLAIWTKAIRSPGDAVIIDDLAERAWVGRVVRAD